MKTRLFLNLSLPAVLLMSCAPVAVTEVPAQPVAPAVVEPSATSIPSVNEASTPTVDLTATYTLELLSATPAVDVPLPVATSRGPNLEATDPTTVNLASGQIQFVEFFRFT